MKSLAIGMVVVALAITGCAADVPAVVVAPLVTTEAAEAVRSTVRSIDYDEFDTATLDECPFAVLVATHKATFDTSAMEALVGDEEVLGPYAFSWFVDGFDPLVDCGTETTSGGYGLGVTTDVNDAPRLAQAVAGDRTATVDVVDRRDVRGGELTSLCVEYRDDDDAGWCEVHWTDTEFSVFVYWYGSNRHAVDSETVRRSLLRELGSVARGLETA